MALDADEMREVKRVKALSIDELREKGIEATRGILGIAEVMLEICDENLEVMISESELRLLMEVYDCLYAAQPFAGLHEATTLDTGLDIFFSDLRQLVAVLDPEQRLQAWTEIFRDFDAGCRHKLYALTAWVVALRKYGETHLMTSFQIQMMLQSNPKGKTYVQ